MLEANQRAAIVKQGWGYSLSKYKGLSFPPRWVGPLPAAGGWGGVEREKEEAAEGDGMVRCGAADGDQGAEANW